MILAQSLERQRAQAEEDGQAMARRFLEGPEAARK